MTNHPRDTAVWVRGPRPGSRVAGRGRLVSTACVSPVCVLLQLSSTGGNLIGPELSPMRHSRPAVACRLSIRAPPPPPPPGSRVTPLLTPQSPANRISSRRHCVPRRLNAFVSPDAKTTHSFRAAALPAARTRRRRPLTLTNEIHTT